MPGDVVYHILLGWFFSKFCILRKIQLVSATVLLNFNMGDGVPGPWFNKPLVLPQSENDGGTSICQGVFYGLTVSLVVRIPLCSLLCELSCNGNLKKMGNYVLKRL